MTRIAHRRRVCQYTTGPEFLPLSQTLPDMPLFLANDFHIMVPLEPTYQATWDAAPEEFRIAVETGVVPDPDGE